MDKFLMTMTKGILIRRHQRQKVAQTVRLFSTTGCKIIQWEKTNDPFQLSSSGMLGLSGNGGDTQLLEVENASKKYMRYQDQSLFHFFIASKLQQTNKSDCMNE